MEIYVLNRNTYDKLFIIDQFESFIWSERYADAGDFELVVEPTQDMRARLKPGQVITHSGSERVMMIEERDISEDSDGGVKMFVKGRDLVAMLENRVIGPNTDWKSWIISGTLGYAVGLLVSRICVLGTGISIRDKIFNMYVANTTRNTTEYDYAVKMQSLYTAVKDLCDIGKLGFGITLREESPRLRFAVYEGVKRNPVVFSTSLDTLTEESYLTSIADYKNIAYVWAKNNIRVVQVNSPEVIPNVEGLDRRVMHVDASDIEPSEFTTPEFTSLLEQRGREALSEHPFIDGLDGKVSNNNEFRYRSHYNLGDIVTLIGRGGVHREVRVTEYIWSYDSAGLTSYPTFTALDME